MNKQLIFYGAGNYAKSALDKLVDFGYVPTCFADADASKHYKKISTSNGLEYEILPLHEAIDLYPNYELVITVIKASFSEVRRELIQSGVSSEYISPPPFYNLDSLPLLTLIQKQLSGSIVKKVEISESNATLTIDIISDGRDFKMLVSDDFNNEANTCFYGKHHEAEETLMMNRILSMLPSKSTIFDVGANTGFNTLCFKTIYPYMDVHAFEPIPHTYEILSKNMQINNLNAIANNIGLSDKEGTVEFFFHQKFSGAASMKNVTGYVVPDFADSVEKISCRVKTLDSYVISRNVRKVDFIKCDTEGSELLVFQGGIDTIKSSKPIVFSEIFHSAHFGYSNNDIVLFFKEIGYLCFVIENNRLSFVESITKETKKTNFIFIHETSIKSLKELICD